MKKQFYLDRIDALRDVLTQLPDDVSICRIYDDYEDGKSRMCIQIMERNDIVPDRIDRTRIVWAEKDYEGLFGENHAVITVGWVVSEPAEEDDEDDDL